MKQVHKNVEMNAIPKFTSIKYTRQFDTPLKLLNQSILSTIWNI